MPVKEEIIAARGGKSGIDATKKIPVEGFKHP
jgi:hypothetical protein